MFKLRKLKISRQQLLMLVLCIIIAYVAVATINVIARNYQLQQRVDELRVENEILALENDQLEYEIAYYRTEAFVEKEARAKLNKKSSGESVVVFSDKIPDRHQPPEPEPEPELGEEVADNFQQWLYFLFRLEL